MVALGGTGGEGLDDLSDWSGNVSVMGMASHEERPSFFCQQIFGKWEGFQLALTTLIGNDNVDGTMR